MKIEILHRPLPNCGFWSGMAQASDALGRIHHVYVSVPYCPGNTRETVDESIRETVSRRVSEMDRVGGVQVGPGVVFRLEHSTQILLENNVRQSSDWDVEQLSR